MEGGVGGCGFQVGGEEGEGFGGGDAGAGVVDGGWVGRGHYLLFVSGSGICQAPLAMTMDMKGGEVEVLQFFGRRAWRYNCAPLARNLLSGGYGGSHAKSWTPRLPC